VRPGPGSAPFADAEIADALDPVEAFEPDEERASSAGSESATG